MDEVKIEVELENFVDRVNAEQGILPVEKIRTFKTRALVDSGAVLSLLPREYRRIPGRSPRRYGHRDPRRRAQGGNAQSRGDSDQDRRQKRHAALSGGTAEQ